MPTIRYTPLVQTNFDQTREALLFGSRAQQQQTSADLQLATARALKEFTALFATAPAPAGSGDQPVPGFLALLLQRLTYVSPSGQHLGLAQVLGDLTQALVQGLAAQGPLLQVLDEMKDCVCQPCAEEPAATDPSATAAEVIATMRPALNALTDRKLATVDTTDAQLMAWQSSKPVYAMRQRLQERGLDLLAAAYHDQGRVLGIGDDRGLEPVRRHRLGEMLRFMQQVIDQVHDEAPTATTA